MSAAASKRDHILVSAMGVFGRYGYRRASMDLIARAAGISRPSLYQYFAGKEDIFRAAGSRMVDDVIAAAELACDADGSIVERLYDALSIKLELVVGTVEAEFRSELLAEAGEIAADLIVSFKDRFVAVVAALLRSAADQLDLLDVELSAHDCAVLLLDAVAGISQEQAPAEVLLTRLRQLVQLTVRSLSSQRSPVPTH